MSDIEQRLIMLQDRLDTHIEDFKSHEDEERTRWNNLITITESNAKSVSDQVEATKGLIEAWEAANGAIKVGIIAGRFIKWLSGFAFIAALYTWWVKTFPPG